MQVERADTLDPDYWIGLGNMMKQGKELLLSYGSDPDPRMDDGYGFNRELLGDDEVDNPFDAVLEELGRPVASRTVSYLEQNYTDTTYPLDLSVAEFLQEVAEFEPTENVLGMNGMNPDEPEIERKVEVLSKYVEISLGETDENGLDMNEEDAGKTRQLMVGEAENIENVLYQTARNV